MGDASYTLIDDNGVEFYLTEKDKRNREMKRNGGKESSYPAPPVPRQQLHDTANIGNLKSVARRPPLPPSASLEIEAASAPPPDECQSEEGTKSLRDVLASDPHYNSVMEAAANKEREEVRTVERQI